MLSKVPRVEKKLVKPTGEKVRKAFNLSSYSTALSRRNRTAAAATRRRPPQRRRGHRRSYTVANSPFGVPPLGPFNFKET